MSVGLKCRSQKFGIHSSGQYDVSSQRICKEPYYRMSLGVSPRNLVVSSDPALNFATASEDDEIYSKKKVSRVSVNSVFLF
ncbi:hypothetical protein TKK_0006216 [Trichogramma kaykai]